MRCCAFDLSSLLTIWIVSITLHLSAADVHICDDTSACDSSIVCAPGESCIVTCTAAYSCKNMQIACPEDNPCEVHCSNRWMLDVSESMRTSLGDDTRWIDVIRSSCIIYIRPLDRGTRKHMVIGCRIVLLVGRGRVHSERHVDMPPCSI